MGVQLILDVDLVIIIQKMMTEGDLNEAYRVDFVWKKLFHIHGKVSPRRNTVLWSQTGGGGH